MGGDGLDSIPLAKMGHTVALVDYSDEMLREARANGREQGVEARMSFHCGEVGAIPQLFEGASQDVILLHNVLTYVDDPKEALECATYPLRPGGMLSLMQINRYSEAMGAAVRQLNLDDAYEKLDDKTGNAKPFGNVPVKRYAPEEMIALIEAQGFELIQQYGILCILQLYLGQRHQV